MIFPRRISLAICSINSLPASLEDFQADAVVSAVSGRDTIHLREGLPHLEMIFSDIEAPVRYGRKFTARGVTHHQMEVFFDFVHQHHASKLLIHCVKGLSRSPALAIAALASHGITPNEACRSVMQKAPTVSPNRWVIAVADDVLSLNGDLAGAAQEYPQLRDAKGYPIGSPLRFTSVYNEE